MSLQGKDRTLHEREEELFRIKQKIFFQKPDNHLSGNGCQKCLYKNETGCREAMEKITGKL